MGAKTSTLKPSASTIVVMAMGRPASRTAALIARTGSGSVLIDNAALDACVDDAVEYPGARR